MTKWKILQTSIEFLEHNVSKMLSGSLPRKLKLWETGPSQVMFAHFKVVLHLWYCREFIHGFPENCCSCEYSGSPETSFQQECCHSNFFEEVRHALTCEAVVIVTFLATRRAGLEFLLNSLFLLSTTPGNTTSLLMLYVNDEIMNLNKHLCSKFVMWYTNSIFVLKSQVPFLTICFLYQRYSHCMVEKSLPTLFTLYSWEESSWRLTTDPWKKLVL